MGSKRKTHGTTWTSGQLLDLVGAVTPVFQVAVDGLEAGELLQAIKTRREELGPVFNTALRAFLNGQPTASAAPTTPAADTVTFEVADEDTDELPEDWELVKDESVVESNGPVTLEEYGFHEEGEDYVGGEVMLARAKEGGRLGLRAARALERQQHLIPKSWRGKVLVFAGTVVLDRDGNREVACLIWHERRWRLYWGWLRGGWGRRYRLVRSRT